MRYRNDEGFTLVEMIIAVVVIGILTAIAIPSYNAIEDHALTSVAKQRATESLSQLRQKAELSGGAGSHVNSDDRYYYLPEYEIGGKTLKSYAVTFNVYGLSETNQWIPCAGTNIYGPNDTLIKTVIVGDSFCNRVWK